MCQKSVRNKKCNTFTIFFYQVLDYLKIVGFFPRISLKKTLKISQRAISVLNENFEKTFMIEKIFCRL